MELISHAVPHTANSSDITHRFTYHPPRDEQSSLFQEIRSHARELAYIIDGALPDGREKSLALTNLEQAVFWANAGVARG